LAYAGTELVAYLSQVPRDELGFVDIATYNAFIGGTLIPEAENFIDNYCGGRDGTLRRFNYNGGSLSLDGSGKDILLLPPMDAPWRILTSLKINNVAVSTSSIHIHNQHLHYYQGVFSEGAQNIMVIGTYGYSSVPKTIQYLCGQLCANMLLDMKRRKRADMANVDANSVTTMLYNPSLMNAPWIFTPDVKKALDEYRFSWIGLG
jgi:hypothetical protein